MADQPASEKTIFHAAAAKASPTERAAYLDESCRGNEQLRREVEALLAAHDRLPAPADDTAQSQGEIELDPPILLLPPGTVIGRYKLLEPIGEGGYGVVFMAEQTSPVQRKVALKIIKAGMDTRQVIARFEAERQALALMDHPNIAKVFDAGVADTGRPYFVMELVKGVPITKYCDEHRLTPRDRLELFVQVCQAVQHAHQKGIIHRDLKPSNVLVALYDGKPVPKVIDFGVAKATGQRLTERTMFTGFGDVIGTPEYMSPEQAELNQLDIDTRSDIYSLGVLLYELLTGTTPVEHKRVKEAALLEVLRVIREEEPPKPSTRVTSVAELPSIAAQRGVEPKKLSGLIKGELDWIVMKALEKDRGRRYETASGFARDVERYLSDEQVSACPPSTWYRFRKYARRNKAGLLAACGVLVTLLALIVVLAVSNRMIAAQRNQTARALREKERALAQAEAQGHRADASFWKAVISVREVMTEPAIGWTEASPALRRHFGEASLKFYQNLLQESGGDPNVRSEAAVGYRMMGTVRTRWEEYPKAEQMFRQAIEILDKLVAEHPTNRAYRYEHAYARLGLAHMLDSARRPDDAAAVRARAIELCAALVAEPPDVYDHLVALATLYREELAARGRAATTQQVQTCIERASALYQRALAASRNPVQYPLDGTDPRLEVGHEWRRLAFVLRDIDRFEEAQPIYRRAIETFEQFQSLDPPHAAHFIADTLRLLARVQVSSGQLGEAEQSLRRAVAIHGERAAKFPDVRWGDEAWAAAYLELAQLLMKTGRPQEAAPLITRAAGFDDPDVQNGMAWRLATDPDPSGRDPLLAVELAQRAIATRLDDANIWNTLGAARYRNGQPKEAIAAFEKSMALRHGGDANDWFFLAMCHWQLGEKDAARKWYDQAVVWTDKYQPNNQQTRRFRAEAAELLKIAATQPTTKAESK